MLMLNCSLHTSLKLILLLAIIHGGAIICLIFATMPVGLKYAAIVFCLFNVLHLIRKYALLSHPNAILHCKALDNTAWQLTNKRGEKMIAYLLGDSWQSRWLYVLNFRLKDSSQRISVVLFSDALGKSAFRRLSVYLTKISLSWK